MNNLQDLAALGQSIWLDNLRRDYVRSGHFLQLIKDRYVTGVTSNPTIFEKAIASGNMYDEAVRAHAAAGLSPEQIFEEIETEDITAAADIFRPVYEKTNCHDGFVSIEVSPLLADDYEKTVKEALRLFEKIGRPNVMIKVPATQSGIRAIKTLTAEGVNVNATLLFSLAKYSETVNAYIEGLEERAKVGFTVSSIASVASFFVSRVDTAADEKLEKAALLAPDEKSRKKVLATRGTVSIANCKLAYETYEEMFASKRFAALREKGAQKQRLLWASTGVKNAAYPATLYVDNLIGPDTVNTMPDATLEAFLREGEPSATVGDNTAAAAETINSLRCFGIDFDGILAALEKDGVKKFVDSYNQLLATIGQKISSR